MSAHKATPDPTPDKEFNPKMQAGIRTYSFANMTAPDKASQLLILFGVASRIAAPDEPGHRLRSMARSSLPQTSPNAGGKTGSDSRQ
jgi:hypothetical protein